jgi:hypothetical protein
MSSAPCLPPAGHLSAICSADDTAYGLKNGLDLQEAAKEAAKDAGMSSSDEEEEEGTIRQVMPGETAAAAMAAAAAAANASRPTAASLPPCNLLQIHPTSPLVLRLQLRPPAMLLCWVELTWGRPGSDPVLWWCRT